MKYLKTYENIDFDDIDYEEYDDGNYDEVKKYIGKYINDGEYDIISAAYTNKDNKYYFSFDQYAHFDSEEIIDIKRVKDINYVYKDRHLEIKKTIEIDLNYGLMKNDTINENSIAFLTDVMYDTWTILTDNIKDNISLT
jgi:hypothetical protein